MWFTSKIPYHLPKASGKFLPGLMDVMLDYAKSGLQMRIYYPTTENISIETNYKKWCPAIPDYDYVAGIARVVMLPAFLINLTWLKSGKVQIPALYGENVRTEEKLKCIIFSHGLGGHKSFYSSICVELASRGYLVLVLEHRDESACHTYYYNSKEDAENNNKTSIDFKKVPLGKGHYDIRKEQVNYRMDEVCKALDFLINLNNGIVPHNVIDDVKTDREIKFKLSDLVGKIDLDNISAGGHSFGGATAMMALAKRKEFKQGIILDPWMYSIKNEDLHEKISQPLLFLNTFTFHIETNVKAMSKFLEEGKSSKMYTIMKSTHENQTDSVFIIGYWLNWFMKKIDPVDALNVNNGLILKFLQEKTGHDANIKDSEQYLEKNEVHYAAGLTKPWA